MAVCANAFVIPGGWGGLSLDFLDDIVEGSGSGIIISSPTPAPTDCWTGYVRDVGIFFCGKTIASFQDPTPAPKVTEYVAVDTVCLYAAAATPDAPKIDGPLLLLPHPHAGGLYSQRGARFCKGREVGRLLPRIVCQLQDGGYFPTPSFTSKITYYTNTELLLSFSVSSFFSPLILKVRGRLLE